MEPRPAFRTGSQPVNIGEIPTIDQPTSSPTNAAVAGTAGNGISNWRFLVLATIFVAFVASKFPWFTSVKYPEEAARLNASQGETAAPVVLALSIVSVLAIEVVVLQKWHPALMLIAVGTTALQTFYVGNLAWALSSYPSSGFSASNALHVTLIASLTSFIFALLLLWSTFHRRRSFL